MTGSQLSPSLGDLQIVDAGWDPVEVRKVIVGLQSQISSLESALHSGRLGPRSSTAQLSTELVEAAQTSAREIRDHAFATAKRIRTRAFEEGREITLQAKKDSLTVIKTARLDAGRVGAEARRQESVLWERVQSLQAAVRLTEQLLREVADGDFGDESGAQGEGPEGEDGRMAVVATPDQDDVERRSEPGDGDGLPEPVERLLSALRTSRRDGS